MTPRVPPSVALAALVTSAGLALWSLGKAVDLDQLSSVAAAASVPEPAGAGHRLPLASAELEKAVGKDPFHPERRRPAVRFQLPGEEPPDSGKAGATPAAFKLIGTATMSEGRGFAMCQWGADPPKLVRIGESVGDLTLKAVQPGRAVFLTTGGKRYEVQVPKAGS
jgi:hypothetical protein